ncbi:hypothetical protein ABIA32_001046 [Streptacidiphilus sp. MAP12-20]|uniref:hypothetical protein n=1 Tax=Streptacidiphilus sp. MAP12-20 TaxID=3156299 RepID=UPI0035171363
MPFEDHVAQTLRDTGEQFTPANLTELVTAGVADGRKRRRRRNVAVLGGSAALALIAVGGALAPSLLGGSPTRQQAQAATGGMSLTASAKPVSNAENARQLLSGLESILPKGGTVSGPHSDWGTPKTVYSNIMASALVVYKDDKGPGAVAVSLTKYAPGTYKAPTCPPVDPVHFPDDVCHQYDVEGGGTLVVDLGYEYSSRGSGTKAWTAWLFRPDGSLIELAENNAVSEKDSPVTRQDPPLTGEQLKAAALSDVWQPLLDQIKTPKVYKGGVPGLHTPAGPGTGTPGGAVPGTGTGTGTGSGASHG